MGETDITKYLLGVVGAALLCGIVTYLLGQKGALGTTVKLLAGIYMTLTIFAPLGQMRLHELTQWKVQITTEADQITLSGQNEAREAMAQSIIDSTRAYILEKAETFGAELTVEVMLDDSSIPVPSGVRIRGNISPYNREKLGSIIQRDLGIPTEAQIWI
ncbi:MAG: hypothetical protein E7448_00265 [Ruminococcaceae bacterium]|nr:hypothetical protein [Oscillospiraceae bacterium]